MDYGELIEWANTQIIVTKYMTRLREKRAKLFLQGIREEIILTGHLPNKSLEFEIVFGKRNDKLSYIASMWKLSLGVREYVLEYSIGITQKLAKESLKNKILYDHSE